MKNGALKNFTLSPIVIASSGRPFNIVTGFDNLGDRHPTTHRPWGVGRDVGRRPGYFTFDVRLARRFGFGSDGRRNTDRDWRVPATPEIRRLLSEVMIVSRNQGFISAFFRNRPRSSCTLPGPFNHSHQPSRCRYPCPSETGQGCSFAMGARANLLG